MKRKSGAAMPPTNCDMTYGPPSRTSRRVKELKVWHWIMTTTARPRIQSRKGNRFTKRPNYHNVAQCRLVPVQLGILPTSTATIDADRTPQSRLFPQENATVSFGQYHCPNNQIWRYRTLIFGRRSVRWIFSTRPIERLNRIRSTPEFYGRGVPCLLKFHSPVWGSDWPYWPAPLR